MTIKIFWQTIKKIHHMQVFFHLFKPQMQDRNMEKQYHNKMKSIILVSYYFNFFCVDYFKII
jgi:hypothetical protein